MFRKLLKVLTRRHHVTSRQSFDSSSALSKSFCCWCLLDPWQDVFRLPTTLSHVWVNLLLVTLLRFDLCYGISKLARRFDEINQKIVVCTFKLVSPLIPSFLVFSSRQYKSKLMRKIMHLVFGLDLNSQSLECQSHPCDQIGRFLNFLLTNVLTKVAHIFW